jgi:speckle-type POZ protein
MKPSRSIRFYPDGYSKAEGENDYITVYLEILGKQEAKVRASCDLRLVDHNTGLSHSVHKSQDRGEDIRSS